MTFLWNGRSIQ